MYQAHDIACQVQEGLGIQQREKQDKDMLRGELGYSCWP